MSLLPLVPGGTGTRRGTSSTPGRRIFSTCPLLRALGFTSDLSPMVRGYEWRSGRRRSFDADSDLRCGSRRRRGRGGTSVEIAAGMLGSRRMIESHFTQQQICLNPRPPTSRLPPAHLRDAVRTDNEAAPARCERTRALDHAGTHRTESQGANPGESKVAVSP